MSRFSSPTHVGVAETFIVMGLIYLCFMMVGAAIVRVPPPGWAPANYAAPAQLTMWATPLSFDEVTKANVGLFAQDQWRIKRLSLNLGLRYDYLNSYVPAHFVRSGHNQPARSDCLSSSGFARDSWAELFHSRRSFEARIQSAAAARLFTTFA